MSNAILEMQNITRSYVQGTKKLTVLSGVNLAIKRGEMVALLGPSGAGKSTLLHIAGLLESYDGGVLKLLGKEAHSERERTLARRDAIGFIYQAHHLLPEFTALENIMLALQISGKYGSGKVLLQRAKFLIEKMGLLSRANHRPQELSGGEQQRIGIARAIANEPSLLLADEPTGSLDPTTGEELFQLFLKASRTEGCAVLMATHNHALAARMDRAIELVDGKLQPASLQ